MLLLLLLRLLYASDWLYPPTLLLPPSPQTTTSAVDCLSIYISDRIEEKKRSWKEPLRGPSNSAIKLRIQSTLSDRFAFLNNNNNRSSSETTQDTLLSVGLPIPIQVKGSNWTFWERREVTVQHFQEGSSFRVLLNVSSIRRVIIHS
jgi:hypothetical protein